MTTTTTTTTRTRTTRTTRTTTDRRASSSLLAFALGSNLGDREAILARAVAALEDAYGPLRVASLYETPAVGLDGAVDVAQPPYLNTVAVRAPAPDLPPLDPEVDPQRVLVFTQELERAAGRRPDVRYAPRPLDIDLLLAGDARRDDPALTLPHPRLRRRLFVLAPLAEVVPELPLPPDGVTAAAALAALSSDLPIVRRAWRRPFAGPSP